MTLQQVTTAIGNDTNNSTNDQFSMHQTLGENGAVDVAYGRKIRHIEQCRAPMQLAIEDQVIMLKSTVDSALELVKKNQSWEYTQLLFIPSIGWTMKTKLDFY